MGFKNVHITPTDFMVNFRTYRKRVMKTSCNHVVVRGT